MKQLLTFLLIAFLCQLQLYSDEGMWIPLFLEEMNEAEMQAMGMNISAEDIFSLNNISLKDAIVIFGGGCTGGIISDKGLILTNHHCGYGRIQALSSLENDYLTNGFWAMDLSEELPAPGLKVTFLVRMEEVTGHVLDGVTQTMTEADRRKKITKNIDSNALVEENKPDSAIMVLDRAMELMPTHKVPHEFMLLGVTEAYYNAGDIEKGNGVLIDYFDHVSANMEYYLSFSQRLIPHLDLEMRTALQLLNEMIRMAEANERIELSVPWRDQFNDFVDRMMGTLEP